MRDSKKRDSIKESQYLRYEEGKNPCSPSSRVDLKSPSQKYILNSTKLHINENPIDHIKVVIHFFRRHISNPEYFSANARTILYAPQPGRGFSVEKRFGSKFPS